MPFVGPSPRGGAGPAANRFMNRWPFMNRFMSHRLSGPWGGCPSVLGVVSVRTDTTPSTDGHHAKDGRTPRQARTDATPKTDGHHTEDGRTPHRGPAVPHTDWRSPMIPFPDLQK